MKNILTSLFLAGLLTACGGGSSSDSGGNSNNSGSLDNNSSPKAGTDNYTTQEEISLSISLSEILENDSDPDNDTITLSSIGNASNGVAILSGDMISYTPNKDFFGSDTFSYTISDGKGGSASGKVNIQVENVNDAPLAVISKLSDIALFTINTKLSFNARLSSDIDGDTLSYLWQLVDKQGQIISLNNATSEDISFQIENLGEYQLSLTVNDGKLNSQIETLNFHVYQAPKAIIKDVGEVDEGTLVTLNASQSIDANNAGLNYQWQQVSGVPVKLLTDTTSEISFYAPEIFVAGSNKLTFNLQIVDGLGLGDQTSITLDINDVAFSDAWDIGQKTDIVVECFNTNESAQSISPDPSRNGEWLRPLKDKKHTRRSDLVGDITCPELAWTINLGVRKSLVALSPNNNVETQVLPMPKEHSVGNSWQIKRDFKVDGDYIDVDGNGSYQVLPSENAISKIGDFLPQYPGVERVSCDSGAFQQGFGGDEPLPCYLQTRENNQWKLVWQSEPLRGFTNNMSTTGQNIVGDFDNDGKLEMAAVGWYEVYVFDIENGEIEAKGVFFKDEEYDISTPRPYGWFGARNIDADPELEFIILGDFEKFVSVLDWDNGKLVEKWDFEIEKGTRLSLAKHDTGVEPIADIDGDGQFELVTSVFNQDGQGIWQVFIFDSTNGNIKHKLDNRHLAGVQDVNGDGKSELFLSITQGHASPGNGPVEVINFVNNAINQVWYGQNEGFIWNDLPAFDQYTNSRATHKRRTMFMVPEWAGEKFVFATKATQSKVHNKLNLYAWKNSSYVKIGEVSGPDLKTESLHLGPQGEQILISSVAQRPDNSNISLVGVSGEVLASSRIEQGDGPAAVWGNLMTGSVVGDFTKQTLLITQGYDELIRAFSFSDGDYQEVWRTEGRGGVTNNGYAPVTVVNLGEQKGVVVTTKGSNGLAQIRMLNEDGTLLWKTDINVPGELPIWNEAGVTHIMAGNYTSTSHEDVVVSYRNSMMASDNLVLLNGKTGEQVWSTNNAGYYSCNESNIFGAGADFLPSFDWDGNGTDDLLSTYSSLFSVINGQSGNVELNRWATSWCSSPKQLFEQGFLVHAGVIVDDLNLDGSDELVYTKNPATLSVLDFEGEVKWHSDYYQGAPRDSFAGVGFFSTKERKDLLVAGYCDGSGKEIKLFNSENGEIKWQLPLPEACNWPYVRSVATADIDGNGKDEAIIVSGRKVTAVGENDSGQGVILWQIDLNNSSEHADPIIVDLDGDGKPTIVINTARGFVLGFEQSTNKQ